MNKILKYSITTLILFIVSSCGENPTTQSSFFFDSSITSSVITDSSNTDSSENEPEDIQYQIFLMAADSGFTGSYEEWLASIRGEDGKTIELQYNLATRFLEWRYIGENEDDWRQIISLDQLIGPPGENGQDGLTPYIGSNGHWWIGLTDTGVVANGSNGSNGIDGVGIDSIEFIGMDDNLSLYRITFTNGDTFDYSIAAGLSAYEMYIQYNPDYSRSEEEWLLDLINGDLAVKEIYTVSFDSDGGTSIASQSIPEGGKVQKPIDPTKIGYNFDGWFIQEEKWVFSAYEITSNMTLTARWSLPIYTASELYDDVSPAIAEIYAFDGNQNLISYGSGFVVDNAGIILTNYHVINRASQVIIEIDGEEYSVVMVKGYSIASDVAFLKVNHNFSKSLNLSTRNILTGEKVFAISNPLGFQHSLTQGIVSYAYRNVGGYGYHQISMEMASGSSGSPLLDARGNVIGLNTFQITTMERSFLSLSVPEINKIQQNLSISVSNLFKQQHIPNFDVEPMDQIVDEIESNNTFIQSQSLISGETVKAVMELNGNDYYKISNQQENEIIAILIPKYKIDLRYFDFGLYNVNGSKLSSAYLSRLGNQDVIIIRFNTSISENYYLRVRWNNQYPWPIPADYHLFYFNIPTLN